MIDDRREGPYSDTALDSELTQRLKSAVANFPDIKTPTIEQLEARIQAREDARPINRLKRFSMETGNTIIEATGFGHGFGDHGVKKPFGNFGQVSYGEAGKEYSATDRIAKKVATLGAIGVSIYLAKNGVGF